MRTLPHETPGGALPSGTVTFVFTDIEGSTQRWERGRAAMEAALRKHDELVRGALSAHGGHVFKTIGDAFCAAFARPEDAVAAALSAQRALSAENFADVGGLPVRAAIHTGTADERAGDYFGPAVNRVARLLAIGHGGQVLVSGVSADLVQGDLPPQASLRDLGEHRLRDLARPEYVYQLVAPELVTEFPPLRSLDVLPNNLPLQFTSLIGREKEIAEITELIEQHRLVTLVGSGGVGKTRTSLQVAANLLDGSGDGVWFIELAPLASGEYIPNTVAQALGITLPADGDPVENLATALKVKHALFVFDNCEHLVEPAARVISAILRACPHVKVIASSRQGLGIAAEETYRLPSLDFPKEDELERVGASGAIRSSAVALFVERARTVDKKFALTDENAPAVVEICQRLDGIPLAIELAASRVRVLSPRQLRERLDERFRVLTGGSRDLLPRQQTLRALIDWSHDLLDERERTLFRRLGIFVNGFTLEGAGAVGSGGVLDELDLFDVLLSLVDKSLVLAEPAGDSLRYRLLESTRAYALEKLSEAGEFDALAARHLAYLRDRVTDLREVQARTARRTPLLAWFGIELEDLRIALDRALLRPDIFAGAVLLAGIGNAWELIGIGPEGVARLETFLAALPDSEPRLLAVLSTCLAELVGSRGRWALQLEAATRAVSYARTSADAPALIDALIARAGAGTRLHQLDEAEEAFAEAEAIPGGSSWQRVRLFGSRAFLSFQSGNLETAARMYEQELKEHRSLGNSSGEATTVLNIAEVEHARGRTERAIALTRETLPGLRRGPNVAMVVNILSNLAGYCVATGDLAGSEAAAREAIALLAARDPDTAQVPFAMEHLALVYALRHDLERAAQLEGFAEHAMHRVGTEREHTEIVTYQRLMELLGAGLPPAELARLTSEGASLKLEAAVALALET